jgi:histidinol-phosphate phosphatase family protein
MNAAVFFDRDDTLIHCTGVTADGDLGDPALVKLMPGARDGCTTLRRAGFTLVVVSNQGGVARGKYGVDAVESVNARVNMLLVGQIRAFRFCPYHPEGSVPEFTREHPWRKPKPGMLLDAARELNIDLTRSWMVGNDVRDAQAGRKAGCRTIFVTNAPPLPEDRRTGDPEWDRMFRRIGAMTSGVKETNSKAVDFIANDVADAARIILRESRS